MMNALKSGSFRVRDLIDVLKTQSTTRAGWPAEEGGKKSMKHVSHGNTGNVSQKCSLSHSRIREGNAYLCLFHHVDLRL